MVVIAWSDEHRDCHGLQGFGQGQGFLPAALGPVQKIPGQQNHLAALLPAELHQLVQLRQLLLPPGPGLLWRQTVEPGAQVQIGAVQDFNHKPSPAACLCTGPFHPG